MSYFSLVEPNMASHLTIVLLHALWQGLLVWLVMAVVLRRLQKRSALLRYGLSVTSLWAMLLLPVLTWFLVNVNDASTNSVIALHSMDDVFVPSTDSANIPIDLTEIDSVWSLDEHETAAGTDSEFTIQTPDDTAFALPVVAVDSPQPRPVDFPSCIVAGVWLTGVLLLSFRLLLGYVWTFRVSCSRLPIDSELLCRLKNISVSLGWKSLPRVFLSSHIKEAIVVGYLKPLVLIPISWTTQLSPEAIEAVIIHELTHIRRFDLWVILVQRIAETLLFFHPAVWSLSKRISYERELCCDAESARLLDSNLSYATALEQVARYLFEQSSPSRDSNWLTLILSPTFGGQKMELLARVQHVLSLPSNTLRPPIKPRRQYHGLTMLMIPALLLGLGISLVHAMGQEPESTAQVLAKPKKISLKEEVEEESSTDKLIFGVDINSDAGVVGQIVLEDSNFEEINPFAELKFIETPDGPAVDLLLEEFQQKCDEVKGQHWPRAFEEAAFSQSTHATFQDIRKLRGIVDPLGGKVISMSGIQQEVLGADPTKIRVTLVRGDMAVNIHYGSDPNADLEFSEDISELPPLSDVFIAALADLNVPFRLFLTNDTTTDAILEQLRFNKHVIAILVDSKHVTEDGLRSLLEIPQLKQLEWLNPCTASGLVEIAKHRSITSLMINVKDLDAESIQPLGKMSQLNRLSISRGRKLDGSFVETLLNLNNLETLQLQFVQFHSDDFNRLQALNKLRSIDFNPGPGDALRLNDDTVKTVLTFPGLQSCVLHHATLASETLAHLQGSDTDGHAKQHRTPGRIYDCTVIDKSGDRNTHDLVSIHHVVKPTPRSSPQSPASNPRLEIEYESISPEFIELLERQEQKAWAEVAQVESERTLQIDQPTGSKLQFARWDGMYLRGVKLQVDHGKQIVFVENGLFQHKKDGVQKSLQADRIEVRYSQEYIGLDSHPITVRAFGNVRYSYQHSPILDANPSLIRGDELAWDLVKGEIEVRSATQLIHLLQAAKDKTHIASIDMVKKTTITDAEWNSRHFAALVQTAKIDYVETSLAAIVTDMNERFFAGRMVIDRQGLKEEGLTTNMRVSQQLRGITLRSALNLLLGDLELGYLVEGGKVTVTTKKRLQKRESERQLEIQKEIEQKLQERISLDFKQKSLSHLAQHLANTLGINIVIDEAGLNEAGIRSDVPITVQLQNVRLETMLNHVLKSLDLGYNIEDEVLKITSRERSLGPIHLTLYRLDESIIDQDLFAEEINSLIKLIRTTVAPDSWAEAGGAGAIAPHGKTNSLVIRQHEKIHTEVQEFLQALKDVRGGKQPEPAPELPEPTPEEIKVNQELKKLMSIDLKDASLSQFFQVFRDKTGLQLYVDQNGLSEAGLELDTKVTFHVDAIMGQSVLKLILDPIGLDYLVRDNVIVISSKERCSGPVTTAFYSIKGLPKEEVGLKGLSELFTKMIAPETWEQNGGSGVVTFDPDSETLIIRQTARVHKQLADYLDNMRLSEVDGDK